MRREGWGSYMDVMPHLPLARAILETARVTVPTLVDDARGRLTPELCDQRLQAWANAILSAVRVTPKVRGHEHVSPERNYVIMSNHSSLYDIPVLYVSLPERRIRMVAKTELFRIPAWGQAMRSAGFVEVDRRNRLQAIESLRRASAVLSSGVDVWIAPEGTRSRDGHLGELKSGGFHLALHAGVPILPVAIRGTAKILPAKTFEVHLGQPVDVVIRPPIETTDYGTANRRALMGAVRESLLAGLEEGGTVSRKFTPNAHN